MPIFPLQSKNLRRLDSWMCPIAHTALSRHFQMSTATIKFTHFKTYWFFLNNHSKLGVMLFLCVMQKNITPSHCSEGNVSEFAVTAVYSSLVFMSSSDRKTHWVFQVTAKKKGSTDFILRFFPSKILIFPHFLFGIRRIILLSPIWRYHWTVRLLSWRSFGWQGTERQKAQWGELKWVDSRDNNNIQHWRMHSAIYQYTFNS